MPARSLLITLTLAALLVACGQQEQAPTEAAPAERPTRITVAEAEVQPVTVTETAIGRIETRSAPMLTAEVSGRVTEVAVDAGETVQEGEVLARIDPENYRLAEQAARAEVQRLQALIGNAERQLERQRKMLAENFITQSAFEETEAQLQALREQLDAAQARLSGASRDLEKATVRAPVSGVIDERLVTPGGFIQAGQPMFRLVTRDLLQVVLPYPETVAPRLEVGQTVYLTTPLTPGERVEGEISELRPALGGTRAVEVIVNVPNPGAWRPGASVTGTVVLDRRENVVLPEVSVVQRPAGELVYLIEGERARAQQVRTGIDLEGDRVEILEGVAAGASVAVDGAAYLTDGALVAIEEARQ